MFDIFQFPNFNARNTEELAGQMNNYIIQFKETLEFVLTNIGTDNLSSDLVGKLNTMGADIQRSNQERDDQIGQVTNKSISVSDVVNSQMFKSALETKVEEKIPVFSINYETGNLEYQKGE